MINTPSIMGGLKDLANFNVQDVCAAGVPVDGTTGAGIAGKGSTYINVTTGENYINTGTLASPAWKLVTHA